MNKYLIEMGWEVHANDLELPVQDILRYAQLPEDLFARKAPMVTGEEYFRLWEGIEYVMRETPTFPLLFGQRVTPEAFNPTFLACLSSQNLTIALKRIAKYKPLIGPVRFDVQEEKEHITLRIESLPDSKPLPITMAAAELVFWVQLARMATRHSIVPAAVFTVDRLAGQEEYETYFGASVTNHEFNGLRFRAEDATRPFLTANHRMWSIFEPELNSRLEDMTQESSFSERVRACLMEVLASGHYSMGDVAKRLAVSTRTLQRRLNQENTSFQTELDDLRKELALHYLTKSNYTHSQIAFMLGYEEPTSFFRAFKTWTGDTPESTRLDHAH